MQVYFYFIILLFFVDLDFCICFGIHESRFKDWKETGLEPPQQLVRQVQEQDLDQAQLCSESSFAQAYC
jgi:hypothetical protein